MKCLSFLLFTSLCNFIQAYNILAFFPIALPSHVKPMQSLFYELAKRGHHVTEYSSFPPSTPLENHTHIEIPSLFNTNSANPMLFRNQSNENLLRLYHNLCLEQNEILLTTPVIQDFIQNDNSQFDVIIMECTFCVENFIALGHKYNAPVINFQPLGYSATNYYLYGNLLSPAIIPDYRTPTTHNLNFFQRLGSLWITINDFFKTYFEYYPKQTALMNKYITYKGYETRPSLVDMLKNISMTFIEYNINIGVPQPLSPNIIFTGGLHIKPAKPLPIDLDKFMNDSPEGVIYFSFGTILKFAHMPDYVKKAYLEAFSRINLKILFKSDDIDMTEVPPNVYVRKWFPQTDILGHKNCKLFLTHGGIHSAMESVYHEVPLVMMPGFSDQFQNVLVLQQKGLGRVISMDSINADVVFDAIQDVLKNPQYSHNAKMISSRMKAPLTTPLESAIYWTEYVIKYEGAHFLKPTSINLSLIQILCLDILCFVLVVLVNVILIVRQIVKYLFRVKIKTKTE